MSGSIRCVNALCEQALIYLLVYLIFSRFENAQEKYLADGAYRGGNVLLAL